MANTGHAWSAAWTTVDAAIVLTQGGDITDTSEEIDVGTKSGIEVSIDVDYSNDAKATGGLSVFILRDVNGTDFEDAADNPWGFEMPFTQNGNNRRTFTVDPASVGPFKILLSWANTTGSSVATVATMYRTADIPKAT